MFAFCTCGFFIIDEHRAQNRCTPFFHVCHSGPNGKSCINRGRFEEIELQRCRTVGKVERLLNLLSVSSVRGRCCGPNRVTYDSGCYNATLKPAGMPDMEWLGTPTANNFVVLPMTFDLKPVLIESTASIALPVDDILKWACVHTGPLSSHTFPAL